MPTEQLLHVDFHVFYVGTDPLLLYGVDQDGWVTVISEHHARHPVAFGRLTRRELPKLKGKRILLTHPWSEIQQRWAKWLGLEAPAERPAVLEL